jgi:hypothetical protein
MPEPADNTAQLVAAITVLRHVEGRLNALDAKIEALHQAQIESSACSTQNRLISVIFGMVKHGIAFSGQISVVVASWFCAGYVWVAHQPYVQGIWQWIQRLFAWDWLA